MNIKNIIDELPWHESRKWKRRKLTSIDKIIVHQELGNGSVEQVNKYHITPGPQNHISQKGAPHFCYHYGIERDGLIKTANSLKDITWHCRGQNSKSIGIMLVGNFSSETYKGTNRPTAPQLMSLKSLFDILTKIFKTIDRNDIYGHCDFGKPACPGDEVMKFIEIYKGANRSNIT